MGPIQKNIFLYIAIIILPTIIALLISWNYLTMKEEADRKIQATNVANLHQQYIFV